MNVSETQLEQFAVNAFHQMKRDAKATEEYRLLLTKRYRNPAGYPTWDSVASGVAGFFYFFKEVLKATGGDWVVQTAGMLCGNLAYMHAPCYWLSKPLAEALLQTDLPPVSDLRQVIPAGVIMLPTGLLRNPDGYNVDWIGILQLEYDQFVKSYQERHNGKLPPEGSRVAWAHVLPSGIAYAQTVGILPNEDMPQRGEFREHHELTDRDAEAQFVHEVSDLVLKTLLVMQSRPDLIEAAQAAADALPTVNRSAKKGKNSGEPLLSPNWIGKDYQPRRESQGGTHASPLMHWRRGHLKRVAIGEGRRERKWVWIEPTLVAGS